MSKFKVGDKVRVRGDLIEYKQYHSEDRKISHLFVGRMTNFINKEKSIIKIAEDGSYILEDDDDRFCWTDEMLSSQLLKYEIYDKIIKWEQKAGEIIIDQGFEIDIKLFYAWCLGRNYITPEQYNDWYYDYEIQALEAWDANYYLYATNGEKVSYAIVQSEDWNKQDQEKAYFILAEYISEFEVEQKNLNRFLVDN